MIVREISGCRIWASLSMFVVCVYVGRSVVTALSITLFSSHKSIKFQELHFIIVLLQFVDGVSVCVLIEVNV